MNSTNVQVTINGNTPSVSSQKRTVKAPRPYTALVNYVLNATQYGDFIDHHTISAIVGINYGLQSYSQTISRANRELARCGKVLKSVKGQGYEVLIPDGYNDHITDMMASACRKMEYAKIVSNNAPTSLMSQTNQIKSASIGNSLKTISGRLLQNVNQVRKTNGQFPIHAMK